MPGTTGPNLGLVWDFTIGEDGWGVDGYNPGFAKLDSIVQLAILDVVNDPPGSPVNGDRYIVGGTPTGDFVGHEDDIAVWLTVGTPAWIFYTPKTGWKAYNEDLEVYYYFNGTAWVAFSTLPSGGSNGDVLTLVAGVPAWAAPTGGSGTVAFVDAGIWDDGAAYDAYSIVTYNGHRYVATEDIPAPFATMGFEGTVEHSASTSTATLPGITTTNPAGYIAIAMALPSDLVMVNSVESTSGFIFEQRSRVVKTLITGHRLALETWFAPAGVILDNEEITVTISAGFGTTAKYAAFGITGTSAEVFDANVAIPDETSGDASVVSVSYTTTTASTRLLFISANTNDGSGTPNSTAPTGFTQEAFVGITGNSANNTQLNVCWDDVSATQSSAAVVSTESPSCWAAIGDALVRGASANIAPDLTPLWVRLTELNSDALDAVFGDTEDFVLTRTSTGWAAAAPAGGTTPALELVSTLTANNTSNVLEWTGLNDDNFEIWIEGLTPATNAVDIMIQFAQGGGPTWLTTASTYRWNWEYKVDQGAVGNQNNVANGILVANGVDNTGGGLLSSTIRLFSLATAIKHSIIFKTLRFAGGALASLDGWGHYLTDTTAITGVRLITTSGNLLSGSATLYKVNK